MLNFISFVQEMLLWSILLVCQTVWLTPTEQRKGLAAFSSGVSVAVDEGALVSEKVQSTDDY